MRHGASLLASLEGMSRPAYRIAKELTNNSRSGLTTRFLAKKLDVPEEEVEYLLDVNHRLFFVDLTKIKLVPDGYNAIRRISDGLENHGDVNSMFRLVKSMSPHDYRRVEEQIGTDVPLSKKAAIELLIDRHYKHPDSVVSYVATRGFSPMAREIFDLLWNSRDGVMPVSQLRIAHGGAEFEVEQALWELLRGFAAFELFRFDGEDRLVRMAALLSEVRQYREISERDESHKIHLKPYRGKPESIERHELNFSDTICRLISAIAARPVRLRGDGELFREDRRRLEEICPEESDPSLNTCLWIAEGAGWLARVDNTLRAGGLDELIRLDRVRRHQILYDWYATKGDDAASRNLLVNLLDELRTGVWYNALGFVDFALQLSGQEEQAVLRQSGAHYQYISPIVSGQAKARLTRSLEGTFFWLGAVDRATADGESLIGFSETGEALLRGDPLGKLRKLYPPRTGEFIVQPNFDIVVPTQDMDPLLTAPLDQFAERTSTGNATVYHVSRETFTQALQEGHDATAFVAFLMTHNRGGALPANVVTTLEDWQGALKSVRLRTLHILETDDPLVLADLMHRRRFDRHFSAIDPKKTIAYTGISRADLVKALEKEGFIVK